MPAAPSILAEDADPWIDVAIGGCLEPKREDRYSNAMKLQAAIVEGERTGLVPDGSNNWSSRALTVSDSQEGGAKERNIAEKRVAEETPSAQMTTEADGERSVPPIVVALIGFVFLGVVGFVGVSLFSDSKAPAPLPIEHNDALAAHLELAPAELALLIEELRVYFNSKRPVSGNVKKDCRS